MRHNANKDMVAQLTVKHRQRKQEIAATLSLFAHLIQMTSGFVAV